MKLIAVDSRLIGGFTSTGLNNDFFSMNFYNHGPLTMRVDVYWLRPDKSDLCDDLDKTG